MDWKDLDDYIISTDPDAHQSLHKEVASLRRSDESAVAPAAVEPRKEQPQPPNPVKEAKSFSYADAAKGKFRGHTVESGPPKEGKKRSN